MWRTDILLFAHGGVLDIIYRIATHRPLETARDFPIPNAALNWIEIGNPDWQLLEWGVCRRIWTARAN